MPIVRKIAYLPICDKCGHNANPEWTRFDRKELIEDLEGDGSTNIGAEYNKKTGVIYCYDCLRNSRD